MKRVIIIGAAGRDFHNFNTFYRGNNDYKVVAFTAAQIPDIEGRTYPAALAGDLYPDGIPIKAEEELHNLINELEADDCVFSYSDVSYQFVMSLAAKVNAAGANFVMLGPDPGAIVDMIRGRPNCDVIVGNLDLWVVDKRWEWMEPIRPVLMRP